MQTTSTNQRWIFILLTSLFLFWGLANNMTDTLLAAFKRIMSMGDFQTTFVQYAFYGAYFCLAIPASILAQKFSYKTSILMGLGLFIGGALLFYPASQTQVYSHFLGALFILAGGLSILETATNPFILTLGSRETAVKRLNLAQSFNPIGSIIGVALSKFLILSELHAATAEQRETMSKEVLYQLQSDELAAVMTPYVGVAIVLIIIWLLIFYTPMPEVSDTKDSHSIASGIYQLISHKSYRKAVLTQFFYVGGQITVWSFTIRYVMEELKIDEAEAANYYLASLALFLVARLIFTYLMNFYEALFLLKWAAVKAVILTGFAIFSSGELGVWALVGVSGCMSLMFPTIYGLGMAKVETNTKLASAGFVMAIVGGAVMTGLQGQLSDALTNIRLSFFVPLVCFCVVVIYTFTLVEKK